MSTTKELSIPGFERVVQTELMPGVISIIAIHNTRLGPALGGCRFYPYSSTEEALTDVMRLAEGMSYKSAMAGLELGGGKAVIKGDPAKIKSPDLLKRFADFVNSLNGRYITAKDVGIEMVDLDIMATATQHVRGTTSQNSSGDPSPMTAFGVYQGLRAAAQFAFGTPEVKGQHVMVQGLGHVGYNLVKHLSEDGAVISACDINSDALRTACSKFKLTPVAHEQWHTQSASIFAPCALGAVLNKATIPQLVSHGVKVVAGGANNQLADIVEDGWALHKHGVVYAPDYIINAGGIINIACEESNGYNAQKAATITRRIYETTLAILERARSENRPSALVSLDMAREKLGL